MKKILAIVIMPILLMVAGCGGGGGSSIPSNTVVVKVSSQGIPPAGKTVAGFGATVELPAGVTVKTGANGIVDASVVVPSGLLGGVGNAIVGSVSYTVATATAKAKLDFAIASTAAAGVGVGEYATLNLQFSGVRPSAADFTATSFDPIDLSGNHITTLSPILALAQ